MFLFLDKQEKDVWLPKLFDLLFENMQEIAPLEGSYSEEKEKWLSEVSPALDKAPRQILLCLMDGELAGYVQYYTREQLLMVEELQITKEYQKTCLFYQLCKHLLTVLPSQLQTIEAYADKRNQNSIHLMEKLGMQVCGSAEEQPFVHMHGSINTIYRIFKH